MCVFPVILLVGHQDKLLETSNPNAYPSNSFSGDALNLLIYGKGDSLKIVLFPADNGEKAIKCI